MIKDLTIGDEKRALIGFTLPMMGSMLFTQLYNLADSFVAGRFISSSALASVGNSYEITLVYIAFAFGINMGCSVIVSQYFGSKRVKEMKSAITTSFIFSAILCTILVALGLLFTNDLLRIIKTPDELFHDSKIYLDIYIYGVYFLFFYNISTGIFTALGDSRTPFLLLAASSITNIFMDILFVKAFSLGVRGIALATFICQGLSCIISLSLLVCRLKELLKGEKSPIFSMKIFKRILLVAVPSVLQQLLISIGNIMIQSVINSFGAVVMAAYAAQIKVNNMIISAFMTIGNGVSSFCAQNAGAKRFDRVRRAHRIALFIGLIVALVIFVVIMLFGKWILYIFIDSENQEIIEVGRSFQIITSPFYLVIIIKLITDGALRGVGRMNEFMLATFSDLFLRVSLTFILSRYFSYIGVWLSWPVGWSVGTIISILFYYRGKSERALI